MKKYILILIAAFVSLTGFSQYNWLEGDSLMVEGGGTFKSVVTVDTNQIKQLAYATDSLDAMPLAQFQDSVGSVSTAIYDIDFTNPSMVLLKTVGGDSLYKTTAHTHIEYALASMLTTQPFDTVSWDTTYSVTGNELKGTSYWDSTNRTISVGLGNGVILQMGQETLIEVYNNSGAAIGDGKVCYGSGINGNAITVDTAGNEGRYSALLFTTEAIANGAYGFCVELAGKARGLNTSALSTGPVFLDKNGDLTNTQPDFPLYNYALGACVVSDATDGIIQFRSDGVNFYNTTRNFFNGIIRESFNFLITSSGTVITGTLTSQNSGEDLTLVFSDGFTTLDVTPGATIVLTPGATDAAPQINYIYILETTKVLTLSTSGWPATEHIKVSSAMLQTAATTATDMALKNHNHNDHLAGTNLQGHLTHMTDRMRQMDAVWESGAEGSLTGLAANAYVQITGGIVYQMHQQATDAFSMPTNNAYVINDFTTPYLSVTDLKSITLDALGNSLTNTSFSLVLWGVANKTGEVTQFMINTPIGTYSKNTPANAVSDALAYSVYTIPKTYKGTGFLIARFTIVNNGGAWTLHDTQDLRGLLPNTSAGGVSGGGAGVTTLLGLTDMPSTFASTGGYIFRVAAGEAAGEFSAPATTIVNGGDSVVLQDEVYDFVNDMLPIKVYRAEVDISSAQVNTLGSSPVILLPAAGVGFYYNVFSVITKVIVGTQLEVGGSSLQIGYNSGTSLITSIANGNMESTTTNLQYCWLNSTGQSTTIKDDDNFACVFSGAVDPSSGSVSLRITLYYTIETY